MNEWSIVYAIPGIYMGTRFEANSIAIVPCSDIRIQEICSTTATAKNLVECFIDNTCQKIKPSILIIRNDAVDGVRTNEAIVSFRNIVALSIIILNWTDAKESGAKALPLFTNSFDFFPFSLQRDNSGFLASTLGHMSYISAQRGALIGMPDSRISYISLKIPLYDKFLFEKLKEAWTERFRYTEPVDYKNSQLFRSIEVAYHALSIPASNDASLFDIGVIIGLWLSAIEILIRPEDSQVNLDKVLKFYKKKVWNKNKLDLLDLQLYVSGSKEEKLTLVQKLYSKLYYARNDFMHGNSVDIESLTKLDSKIIRPIWHYAPILYRVALSLYLADISPCNDAERYAFYEEIYADCLRDI